MQPAVGGLALAVGIGLGGTRGPFLCHAVILCAIAEMLEHTLFPKEAIRW